MGEESSLPSVTVLVLSATRPTLVSNALSHADVCHVKTIHCKIIANMVKGIVVHKNGASNAVLCENKLRSMIITVVSHKDSIAGLLVDVPACTASKQALANSQ